VKVLTGALRAGFLAAIVAATVLSAASASGQTTATAPRPVTLILDLGPDAPVDAERLRDAIARELGAPVVWRRNADGGTLVVRQAGARVIVSFDGPDGRHDGRSILLLGDPAQAQGDIVLLAGNVARDQAAQFEPPPRPVTPAVPPAAAPPGPTPPPLPCDATGPRLAAAIDFVPWLGVSTVDQGRSIRRFSLGALGALSGGVQGLAVSGLVDLDRGPLCGLQLSGIASVAADARGVQVGGTVSVARSFSGVQLGGVVSSSGSDSNGIQIATVNVVAGRLTGAQIGAVNVAGMGLRGVQIGAVNYSSDADLQLGAININASGRFLVDAWANAEMGLLLAGVKHGGRHYHWIYALGTRAADTARPWAALGLGAHLTPAARAYVDLDLIDELQLVFPSSSTLTNLYEARAVIGYRLAPQLSVFAGPTYNVLVAAPSARAGAPGYATELATSSSTVFQAWPGLTLGVEGL